MPPYIFPALLSLCTQCLDYPLTRPSYITIHTKDAVTFRLHFRCSFKSLLFFLPPLFSHHSTPSLLHSTTAISPYHTITTCILTTTTNKYTNRGGQLRGRNGGMAAVTGFICHFVVRLGKPGGVRPQQETCTCKHYSLSPSFTATSHISYAVKSSFQLRVVRISKQN